MKCPRCDSPRTRVVDSREGLDGRSVRRRRECEASSFRFTTFERVEEILPMVIKKGGQRESFDRYKILSGLKKACEKRPVSVLQMEDIVKYIEGRLLESGEKEVSSQEIGEMVIRKLQEVDTVAYVRFASVYREFSDINQFFDTLRHLVSTPVPQQIQEAAQKKVFSLAHARKERNGENSSNEKLTQKGGGKGSRKGEEKLTDSTPKARQEELRFQKNTPPEE